MRPELREKIIAYNRTQAERKQKTEELERIVAEFMKLPSAQIMLALSAEVKALLKKHGYKVN